MTSEGVCPFHILKAFWNDEETYFTLFLPHVAIVFGRIFSCFVDDFKNFTFFYINQSCYQKKICVIFAYVYFYLILKSFSCIILKLKNDAEDTSKCSALCGLKSCFKSVFQYKPYNTAFLAPSTFNDIE